MRADDVASQAGRLLEAAVAARIFPAACAEVGNSRGPLWKFSGGTLAFDADEPCRADTIFDLASLTKPIATTTLILSACADRTLSLEQPIAARFSEWAEADRVSVTVRDLLEHCSGLPARLFDRPPEGRREFIHEICRIALEYTPRSRSLYSDLDFLLLGFLVEDLCDASLDALFRASMDRLALGSAADSYLKFATTPDVTSRVAPTEPMAHDRRKRRLRGEVHDDYAAALKGVAGHAGLFGTADAVGAFAIKVLRGARGDASAPPPLSPSWITLARTKSTVEGSSRALGWDTMLPTSSCGARMSPDAFGHVGHTGTSLWIAPSRDRYYVLLTNRVCGGGSSDDMQAVRRAFHDTLADF